MAGLKWKPKPNREGGDTYNCWITQCNYTVAKVFNGTHDVFVITAPLTSAAFAYVNTRNDAVKAINNDKDSKSASN